MQIPKTMQATILWYSVGAAAVGVPGAFMAHADIPVLTGIWIKLMVRLASQAGASMDKAKAAKIVAGVLVGAGTVMGGIKLGATLFAWTGVGTGPAIIINSSANATVTYLFGRSVASVFLSNSGHDSAIEMIRAIIALMIGSSFPGDSGHA